MWYIIGGVALILVAIGIIAFVIADGDWEDFRTIIGIIFGMLAIVACAFGGIVLIVQGLTTI